MIKFSHLFALAVAVAEHYNAVSADRETVELAASNLDQSHDGKRLLRGNDESYDAANKERVSISKFADYLAKKRWKTRDLNAQEDLDIFKFLRKNNVKHDKLTRIVKASGGKFEFDNVIITEEMAKKYHRFLDTYVAVSKLLGERKFNPHDDYHQVAFIQDVVKVKTLEQVKKLMREGGHEEGEIKRFLDRYSWVWYTNKKLKHVTGKGYDMLNKMNILKIKPWDLHQLTKLHTSFYAGDTKITRHVVEEYKNIIVITTMRSSRYVFRGSTIRRYRLHVFLD
ncbi:hypothetical protein PsorP6_016627 [Peronosclerospora sorghi]|uniref:Uncharacterized protein n=1 Tax=Peronosclerospora sorghi TaxID=230839 RepID=A0ACC0VQ35_9STRA|nr:hypothetical protein PsorP6_016627 [Peronosclerospora sorghi]